MNAGPGHAARTDRLAVVAMWLACCAALLALSWQFIGPMNFRDPDDALRLVQVRDLIGGQGWLDLTQHRINPPEGVSMHWSRLVDLPVALLLLIVQPLAGQALAERIVLVAVPLVQLLLLALITHASARALGLGRGTALLAVAMLLSALSILIQFAPLRIDHHAMQILCGAVAMHALVRSDRHDGRRGLIAGLAMACWLQISIEGLPYAVVAGGVLALAHVLRADRWADLRAYMLALPIAGAALLFGTRQAADAVLARCDSFSPNYLIPLGLVTALLLAGHRLAPGRSALTRAIPLGIAGAAGVAAAMLLARACLAGPFETLDPLVYELWYLAVREGLPVTAQKADLQAIIVAPGLIGLIGTLVALRRAETARMREAWLALLIMQGAALAVALMVMRAMAFAHLTALPGNAVLLALLIAAMQRLPVMPVRVVLTAACALVTPLGASAIIAGIVNGDAPGNNAAAAGASPAASSASAAAAAAAAADAVPDRYRCTTQATLRGLDALPLSLIFSPLDIGAHLLSYTRHSVVATGHHRNEAGMKAVLQGLTASPDQARTIIAATGADYIAMCRRENEVERYRRLFPRSLTAALLADRPPHWLKPVPMRPGETVRVYRIVRTAG